MASRLSGDALDQLTPLPGSLVRLIARGSPVWGQALGLKVVVLALQSIRRPRLPCRLGHSAAGCFHTAGNSAPAADRARTVTVRPIEVAPSGAPALSTLLIGPAAVGRRQSAAGRRPERVTSGAAGMVTSSGRLWAFRPISGFPNLQARDRRRLAMTAVDRWR